MRYPLDEQQLNIKYSNGSKENLIDGTQDGSTSGAVYALRALVTHLAHFGQY